MSKLDHYPIPKIEDLFSQLAGGKSFTKLDLSQGYQQICQRCWWSHLLPCSGECQGLSTVRLVLSGRDGSDWTSLTMDDICSILQLCLEATYLAFEGKVYRQIHGTAMGSPVSVVVANLVMEDVEQEALSTFHTPPWFWRRYVDDTCTALPSDLVDSFHNHPNSIDPCIQFTMEKKSDRQLPFLDILLSREEDGSISTSVHRTIRPPTQISICAFTPTTPQPTNELL